MTPPQLNSSIFIIKSGYNIWGAADFLQVWGKIIYG